MPQLERILEDLGLGRYHMMQNFLLGGAMLVDGAEMMLAASILTALQNQWLFSSNVKSYIMSVIFIGVAVGGVVGGRAADLFGRWRTLVLSYIGVCTLGGLSALSNGPFTMALFRLGMGFSFGAGLPAMVAMTIETSSSQAGKLMLNYVHTWFIFGEAYASFLLYIFMPTLRDTSDVAWRQVTWLTVLPSVMLLPGVLCIVQESPAYLLSEGRKEEGLQALRFIANFCQNNDIVAELTNASASDLYSGDGSNVALHEYRFPDHGSMSQPLEEPSIESERVQQPERPHIVSSVHSWSRLLTSEFAMPLLAGCYLTFVANALAYGVAYMLPDMLQVLDTSFTPATQLGIASFASAPGLLMAGCLLHAKSLSDKDRLQLSISSVGILMVSLAFVERPLYQLAFVCMVKACMTCYFNLVYIVIGRIFPCGIRCTATSICITGGRVGSILAPIICQYTIERYGNFQAYFLFCASQCIFVSLVVRFFLDDYDYEYVDEEYIRPGSCGADGAKSRERRVSRRLSARHTLAS
eukprot:TRINITY_DN73207_c0_g1_i1.p1 TRINITY_DN73207_c0_g1~~TRINITY_DN73207_c0_g1_i1.p1  ORF type:complete len:524 (+),score=37.62 TRINITY_DN73207_c0_g1_i1:58-1629(+)